MLAIYRYEALAKREAGPVIDRIGVGIYKFDVTSSVKQTMVVHYAEHTAEVDFICLHKRATWSRELEMEVGIGDTEQTRDGAKEQNLLREHSWTRRVEGK